MVDGDKFVIVAQARPGGTDNPATRVGQRVPFGAPFGVCNVPWAPDAEVGSWFARSSLHVSVSERALHESVFEGIRARGYGVERLVTARSQLHDALLEFRGQTLSSLVLDRLRENLPNLTVREYLPDELTGRGRVDVGLVHAPERDGAGMMAFTVSAHLRRTVSRSELRRIGSLVLDETLSLRTRLSERG
jgi:hypothetical protein